MKQLEAYMSNGDCIRTSFNGSASDAMHYYIGKTFNLGIEDDKIVYGCALVIDGIRYNPATHKSISEREHEKNRDLIAAREFARGLLTDPLVGDFVLVGGALLRFTHEWDNGLQTTCKRLGDATHNGGFYLSKNGRASYSGSLDPEVRKDALRLTHAPTRPLASFWLFSGDYAAAHNAVTFYTPCRVWALKEEA